MTGKELERLLGSLTALTATDLDLRTRKLRGARMVPVGGRGPHAPDYQAEHVATFLICIGGTESPSDAANAVLAYAPLRYVGVQFGGFLAEDTLADAITRCLADPRLAATVQAIRFCRSWPMVEMEYDEAGQRRVARYLTETDLEAANDEPVSLASVGASTIRSECVIGGGLLQQIAIELSDEERGGWAVDRGADQSAIEAQQDT